MFGETIVGSVIQFVLGFSLLTAGAELLVRGAGRLAARFNVPAVVIGLTIVAFGTSLPELLVSVVANLEPDGSELAIGNIVGSNIANLALILGVAGLLGDDSRRGQPAAARVHSAAARLLYLYCRGVERQHRALGRAAALCGDRRLYLL